jgi:hypothetical protein
VNEKGIKDASKFDWVTERSSCSLPKIFKELRSEVEGDIKTRNSLRPENSPYTFSVEPIGADFRVVLTAKGTQRSVAFSLAEHAILVKDDKGEQMFEVTLTFSDDGECKLNVGKEERDYWQIRRMALEELLFTGN